MYNGKAKVVKDISVHGHVWITAGTEVDVKENTTNSKKVLIQFSKHCTIETDVTDIEMISDTTSVSDEKKE